MADELNHIFHERFCIRPRNEHIARDVEFQAEEMGAAGEIGDRFLLGRTANQVAVDAQLSGVQRPLIIGIKLDSGNRQDVRQKQFAPTGAANPRLFA